MYIDYVHIQVKYINVFKYFYIHIRYALWLMYILNRSIGPGSHELRPQWVLPCSGLEPYFFLKASGIWKAMKTCTIYIYRYIYR